MNDPKRPTLKPDVLYCLMRVEKGTKEFLVSLLPVKRDTNPKNARYLHGDFLNETRWSWYQQGNRALTEAEMHVEVKQWNAAKSPKPAVKKRGRKPLRR